MGKNSEATLLLRIKEAGAEALDKVKKGFEEIAAVSAAVSAAITGALGLSVKAYAESEEASNKLALAIRNQGLDVETLKKRYDDLASAIQAKSTYDDDEITAALALGQALAGNVALTDDLIKATVDYAAATGTDLNSAFEKVGKSIGTANNALAREGVELDTAADKSDKMAKITAVLTERFEGFAEVQADGLGSVKQLNNAIGNLAEQIGKNLAPYVTSAAKSLTELVNTISQNEPLVSFGTIIATATAAVTGLVAAIGGLALAWPAITAGATAVAAALGPVGLAIAAVSVAFGTLAAAWTTNLGQIQETTFGTFAGIQAFFGAFADDVMRIFGGIRDVIGGALALDFDQMKKGIAALSADTKISTDEIAKAYREGFKEREKTLQESLSSEKDKEAKQNSAFLTAKKKVFQDVAKEQVVMHDSTLGELRRIDEQAFAEQLEQQKVLEQEKATIAEETHRAKMEELGRYANTMITSGFQGIATQGLEQLTNVFLPGFGQAAGAAFELLSQDSDKFMETINQLFSAEFLDNIATNIPVLLETFADKLPGLIDKLAERLPDIVQRLIESLIEHSPAIAVALAKAFTNPAFYEALVLAIVNGLKDGLTQGFQDAGGRIAESFKTAIETGVIGAMNSAGGKISQAFKDAIEDAWDAVKDIFSVNIDMPGGGGGGGGGGVLGKIGKGLRFSQGGFVKPLYASQGLMVPRGMDTVPAMLSPGEFVVNAGAAAKHMDTLMHINRGGSQLGLGGSTNNITLNVYGGLLGDKASAMQMVQEIDRGLLELRRGNGSVAFDSPTF